MGKKSVVDSSFMESVLENVKSPSEVRDIRAVDDLQVLLIQMLKSAQQTQEKALDMLVYYYHYH